MTVTTKNYNWLFAIALSLLLGLSSVVAATHSHIDDISNSCSVCLLQPTASTVEIQSAIDVPLMVAVDPGWSSISVTPVAISSKHLARAPPLNL